MFSLFANTKNIIIAGLITTIIILSISIWQKNRTITNLKMLNNYYELQFKSLADSYKTSLEKFETQKRIVHKVYKDKIKTAVKIAPNEECEYLKKRIKEYVIENNNTTDNNTTF